MPANKDLVAYLTDYSQWRNQTFTQLGLLETTITSVTDNEVLAYDDSSSGWINQTAAEAGLSEAGHSHDISDDTNLAVTAPVVLTDDTISLAYDSNHFRLEEFTLFEANAGSNIYTIGNGGGVNGYVARKFDPTTSGDLKNVYVEFYGSGTYSLYAELRADNAGEPDDSILGTSAEVTSIPTSGKSYTVFTFATAISISSGTDYWVVIYNLGASEGTFYGSAPGGTPGRYDLNGQDPWSSYAGEMNVKITAGVAASVDLTLLEDGVDDTHIDWGTGANQVNAADLLIADGGDYYTGEDVEAALQEIGAGKANVELDNLSSVAINTSLISDTDSTDDLGSSSKAWANLYVDTVTTLDGNNLSIRTNTTDGSDNKQIWIYHGDRASPSSIRGAYIVLEGNEVGGGDLVLVSGNVSTGEVLFKAGNLQRQMNFADTALYPNVDSQLNLGTNSKYWLRCYVDIIAGPTVFNEEGVDVDFRFEGLNDVNLLYLDAGNDRVGIGVASPDTLLHLLTVTTTELRLETSGAADPALSFKTTNSANHVKIYLDESETNEHLIIEGQTAAIDTYVDVKAKDGENAWLMLYSGSNRGGITYSSGDVLRIRNLKANDDIRFNVDDGSGNTDLLALDASVLRVGIGTTSPDARLEIENVAPADIVLLAKAAASQSASLQEWQDSAGNVDSKINADRGAAFGAFDDGNYTEFEADGTLKMVGDATVFNDLQFAISNAKVPASNAPTWETFTANTNEYGFAVNDYIDSQANETPHSWKLGATGHVHIHVTTKAANATGSDRFAKFTVWVAYADTGETWQETSFTAELTIPNGTSALEQFYLDMGNLTLTNYVEEAELRCRIKRIAATGGTEYAGNIFITQIGIHLEEDTIGSRTETSK